MSRNYRISVLSVLLILLLGVLTSSVLAQDTGGSFAVIDPLSNVELDPFITSWHSWAQYALFSTLLSRDKDLKYVAYLADSWKASEDGKTISMTLIKDAKFSDGTPVNAEAIKWNLLHWADKDVAAPGGADLVGLLEDVVVTGDYSFDIKMASAYAPIYSVLNGLEIVSPTAYQKEGKDNFLTHPVGAGPFILKEINTNNYYSFVKNPDFKWAPPGIYSNSGPIPLDDFTIKFIGDDQTALAALETGEVQFGGIPNQNINDVKDNKDLTLKQTLEQGIRYMGFNTSKAPWDNKDLRRAISYAINKEEFVQLAFNGQADPLYQPLPSTIWGHNPDLDKDSIHFDLDKANSMLDDLGYKDVDGDGVREQPDGSKWVVPLAVYDSDEGKHEAEAIQSQLADAGINIEINVMAVTALRDLTTTGKHDLFLLYYGSGEPSILTYFFSSARKGGTNRAWFSTPELDALLQKADSDLNQDTRYQTITEISKTIMDNAPWVFLVVPKGTVGIRNEMKNWTIDDVGDFFYFNSYITKGG